MFYRPIIGTLGFILSKDGKSTLLVHRNARPNDEHFEKYNGLGGKMKPGEDVVRCIQREIMEEAGIECLETVLRGTINWTGFGPKGEDWLGFIFRINRFKGTPFLHNQEGSLSWHSIDRLNELPMWEGDRHFLPMVFDDDPRAFHGYMPYQDHHPVDWHYIRI
ncbi:MAG: 8-oxo-dGTP diphosphatase [Proteobacteria bacterium]|nr:8-oxo-dGTP diphosphatase [Pseudomonadota bacterium]MBU1685838.1 8-oxo-dGTP diphosphatase [Pseudomonadota bacterium]